MLNPDTETNCAQGKKEKKTPLMVGDVPSTRREKEAMKVRISETHLWEDTFAQKGICGKRMKKGEREKEKGNVRFFTSSEGLF